MRAWWFWRTSHFIDFIFVFVYISWTMNWQLLLGVKFLILFYFTCCFFYEFEALEGHIGLYCKCYIVFINVRQNWCESLWRVWSVGIALFYFAFVYGFDERNMSFCVFVFVIVSWKVIWQLLAGVKFSNLCVLQCFVYINDGSWKGHTGANSICYFVFYFINVSWKLMWERVKGVKC